MENECMFVTLRKLILSFVPKLILNVQTKCNRCPYIYSQQNIAYTTRLQYIVHSTSYNRPDKNFSASLHKSKKHFGHSFVVDGPMVWNDLPDDVHSAPNYHLFQEKVKIISLSKGIPD